MEVLGHDRREGLGRRADPRVSLLTLILVSILLLLSSLYSAEASVFRKARETVIDAAAPALAVFAGPIAYIQNAVGGVRDYFNVLKQNQALREENAELRQWMNEALALRETISAYEALEAYHAPPQAQPVNAVVIGESNDVFSHSMLVNAGAADGVRRGQAVVDASGLVGRIVDVGQSAARVLLLTDVQSRAPVYIEGADIEGLLVGRTKDRPAISFTASSEPVVFKPGQRVLTSGAGGVLPRGLPVGVVVEDRDGEAIVDLYANYARTRLVRVINYEFPELEIPAEGAAAPAGAYEPQATEQAAPDETAPVAAEPAAPQDLSGADDEPPAIEEAAPDETAPVAAEPAAPEEPVGADDEPQAIEEAAPDETAPVAAEPTAPEEPIGADDEPSVEPIND